MPLFHIHGLIASLLAPLAAGSLVFCTPGFNALRFFAWMSEAKPTWYTAVPTMHQAHPRPGRPQPRGDRGQPVAIHPILFVVDAASGHPGARGGLWRTADRGLRHDRGFASDGQQSPSSRQAQSRARSGSPPAPRSPSWTKQGDAVATGPDGRDRDPRRECHARLRKQSRAPTPKRSPTAGSGPATRADDADGYLTITGRLKEIINRGGEKISPREVDEVLMDHPAILQVVTFAVPHVQLGEDVATAVVLREGASLSEKELREFAARRLADFKVPRKVLFLPEIPKGATGKAPAHRPGRQAGTGSAARVSVVFRSAKGRSVAERHETTGKLFASRSLAKSTVFDLSGLGCWWLTRSPQ